MCFLAASALGQSTGGVASPPPKSDHPVLVSSSATPAVSRSTPPDAVVPPTDVVDFARRQIDLETQRLDKLVSNTEAVGKIMATLIVTFAAILSYFGYRSIKELKDELQASVEGIVEKNLKQKNKSGATFDELANNLSKAQTRWDNIAASIDNLARFEALSSSQFGDAQGAYWMAKQISEKQDLPPDERRAALGYLLKIVELGEQGRVDPNLLFNACSLASEMDFDHEALKLASLCAHWDPKPSHILRKSRLEDVFGMRFELTDHKLALAQETPMTVRAEAWKAAQALARQPQWFQCELIYSELHNIAVRNRESGYVDDAIGVLEEVTKSEAVPSYAFAVLSGFYAMRGNATWLDDYLAKAAKAVEILAKESPASTWYEHTVRDLMKMAAATGKTREIQRLIQSQGLTKGQQDAAPNGGPAMPVDNSGVAEGPPSVS